MIIKKMDIACRQIIRWLGILCVGYLFLQGLFTICCIQRVEETTYFMSNNVLRQLLCIVAVILVVKFVGVPYIKPILERHGHIITWALLGVQVVFLCVWTGLTQFWANGDMEKVFQYAGMFLAGDFSGWQAGGYPHEWPHQNGLILFVAGLLRVFDVNQAYLAFYGVNILFYALTIIGLHYALRVAFPAKPVYCAQTICLILYLPYAFHITLLYGNVIGFGFAALALMLALLYVAKPSWVRIILAAVCMALGIIFKQNETIILVAILILLAAEWFLKKGKRLLRLGQMAVFLLIVLLGVKVPNLVIETASGMELEGGNSKWAHVAMGLMECDAAPGWYNGYNDEVFRASGYDTKVTGEAALEMVAQRVQTFVDDPAYAWRFFHKKQASQWNNPTFECFHIQNSRGTSVELNSLVNSAINDGGKLNILLIYLMDMLQSVTLFGVLIYLLTEKQPDWRQLLFVICFLGAFVFWGIWEAKGRYVVPFYLLLIPYSILGYRQMARLKMIRLRLTKSEDKTVFGVSGLSKNYLILAVLLVLIVIIAMSQNAWIADAFKINDMTQEYYDYIHQFGQNLTNLRF